MFGIICVDLVCVNHLFNVQLVKNKPLGLPNISGRLIEPAVSKECRQSQPNRQIGKRKSNFSEELKKLSRRDPAAHHKIFLATLLRP